MIRCDLPSNTGNTYGPKNVCWLGWDKIIIVILGEVKPIKIMIDDLN